MSMEDPMAALLFLAEQIRQSQAEPEEDPCEPPEPVKAVRKPTARKRAIAKQPKPSVVPAPPKPRTPAPPKASTPEVAGNGAGARGTGPRVTVGEQLSEMPPSTALLARTARANGGRLKPPGLAASRVPGPPPPRPQGDGSRTAFGSDPDRPLIGPERAPALESQQLVEQGGILLRPGGLRIEPSFTYTRSDRARILFDGVDLVDVVFIGTIASDELRTETMTAALTFRYGLSERFNIRATIPYEYRKTELFPLSRDQAPISALRKRRNSSLGDISLGLSYLLYKSDSRLPSLVANLNYSPDTGDPPYTGRGYDRMTGGITFLTQSDPAVLFGSLSYTANRGDYEGFTRGNWVGGSIGYSYALNYDLSLSTTFSYLRQIEDSKLDRPNGGSLSLAKRETNATLSLGVTYALSRNKAFALSVGIGLTDETPELSVSMSLPMAFNTSGWW
jgi:hypothetical protein